jgi:hypothetical protein
MSNLNALNPFAIMGAFMAGNNPQCTEVTLDTVDIDNNKSNEKHFVALIDLKNMDPSNFPNNTNPYSGASIKEEFSLDRSNLSNDPIIIMYFVCLSLIGIYILYKIMLINKI